MHLHFPVEKMLAFAVQGSLLIFQPLSVPKNSETGEESEALLFIDGGICSS